MTPPVSTSIVPTATRRTCVVFLALVLGAWLFTAAQGTFDTPTLIALAMATVIGAALSAVAWWRQPPHALTLIALLAGLGLYLAARLGPTPAPETLVTPWLCLGAVTLAVFAGRYTPVVGTLFAIPVLVCELVGGLSVDTLAILGPALATATMSIFVIRLLNRLEAQWQESRDRLSAATQRAAASEARYRVHRNTQSVLHDHVLAALRLLADPDSNPDTARATATRAWEALAATGSDLSAGGQEELSQDLAAALRGLSVAGVSVELDLPRGTVPVTPAAVEAMLGASAEALRNVAKHAGTATARVALESDDGEVRVSITDHGRGFDIAKKTWSYGLRNSVALRLQEVGGAASVHSEPGQGTRVVLRWRAPGMASGAGAGRAGVDGPGAAGSEAAGSGAAGSGAAGSGAAGSGAAGSGADGGTGPIGVGGWRANAALPAAGRRMTLTAAIGDARAIAATAFGPFALLALGWAAYGLTKGQSPWLAVWALGFCATGVWVVLQGEARASSPALDALEVLAILGVFGFLATAPASVFTTPLAWPIGLAALSTGIAATFRPRWHVITTTSLVGAVALFAVLTDPDRSMSAIVPALPAMLSACWPIILAATLRGVIIALAEHTDKRSELTRATLAREAAATGRQVALARRVEQLRHILEPTLGAVARGDVAVTDPELRREAAAAEHTARDELVLPEAMTPVLARAVRLARERGVEIALTTTSDLVRTPPIVSQMLGTVLAAPSLVRVTLTAAAEDAPVTLVADIQDPAERAGARAALTAEGVTVRELEGTILARAGAAS